MDTSFYDVMVFFFLSTTRGFLGSPMNIGDSHNSRSFCIKQEVTECFAVLGEKGKSSLYRLPSDL